MPLDRHKLDKKVVFKLLESPSTFGTVLHIIALTCYGEEIYDLDIEEMALRLDEDFHAKLNEQNENKFQAIMLATSTDAFFEDVRAFTGICSALVEGDPGVDMLDDLTTIEAMWGMYEVGLSNSRNEFDVSISKKIQSIVEQEGYDPSDGEADPLEAMREARSRLEYQLRELGVPSPELPPIEEQSSKPPLLAGMV